MNGRSAPAHKAHACAPSGLGHIHIQFGPLGERCGLTCVYLQAFCGSPNGHQYKVQGSIHTLFIFHQSIYDSPELCIKM